jgi:hypothetical protein
MIWEVNMAIWWDMVRGESGGPIFLDKQKP